MSFLITRLKFVVYFKVKSIGASSPNYACVFVFIRRGGGGGGRGGGGKGGGGVTGE